MYKSFPLQGHTPGTLAQTIYPVASHHLPLLKTRQGREVKMAAGGLECVQGVLYICQLYLLHHLQFAGAKLLLPLREGLKDEIKFVCVCVLERVSYVLIEDMEAFFGSDVYFSPLSFYLIGP